MLNLEELCQKGTEQAFLDVHNTISIPQLSVLFIFMNVIFLIVGMLLLSSKEGKRKFYQIFLMALIINGLVFVFLLMFPLLTKQLFGFFS